MKYKLSDIQKMTIEQLKEVIKENENGYEFDPTLSELCRMAINRKA